MHVNTALADQRIARPDRRKNFLTCEISARVLSKKIKYEIFSFGQAGWFRDGRRPTSTEHGFDTCKHRVERKRLCNVIVGSSRETLQLIVMSIEGCKENNRGVIAAAAECRRHLKTRHTVHHDIEHQHVVASTGVYQCKGILGTESSIGLVAFTLKIKTENLAEILFVVYYEYLCHIIDNAA